MREALPTGKPAPAAIAIVTPKEGARRVPVRGVEAGRSDRVEGLAGRPSAAMMRRG
jgi:hypothetical protein